LIDTPPFSHGTYFATQPESQNSTLWEDDMNFSAIRLGALFFGLGFSLTATASDADEAIRLARTLVRSVEDHAAGMDSAKLQQLNRDLSDLIDRVGQGGGGGGSYRLICKSSDGKAAIYNLDTGAFIDRYYGQTLADCNRILNASREHLTCSSNENGKTAIYNLKLSKYIDRYYAKNVDQCVKTLQNSRHGLTCATDESGEKAAIYDVLNDKFVDNYYDKTLDECLSSI